MNLNVIFCFFKCLQMHVKVISFFNKKSQSCWHQYCKKNIEFQKSIDICYQRFCIIAVLDSSSIIWTWKQMSVLFCNSIVFALFMAAVLLEYDIENVEVQNDSLYFNLQMTVIISIKPVNLQLSTGTQPHQVKCCCF